MQSPLNLVRKVANRLLKAEQAAPQAERPERQAGGPAFENGHFYSPVVDIEEATRDRDRIWPTEPHAPGVDFHDAAQEALLRTVFPELLREFDYPEALPNGAPAGAYHLGNSEFGWLDARALFVLLRHLRPRRMVEVGSGFSSLLTADVNRRFLGGALDFTCIEPYPRPFLVAGVPGISRVITARVQDAPMEPFERLGAGDFLFIDSSHVSKTGSDLNHLVFEVLPRLAPGVVVHFHDVFLPMDYPPEWVLSERRSWNEQYVVHALLLGGAFDVVFGSAFAAWRFPDLVRAALGGDLYGGGSFWVRRRSTGRGSTE